MRLYDLVLASRAIQKTRSRKEKAAHLADSLRRLGPDEVRSGAAYLYGELPGGRLGVGWAALEEARSSSPATAPGLEILDVERALDTVRAASGPGSRGEKARVLGRLFASATDEERAFLTRLLLGELRQGALEGVMVDAVAQAADAPVAEVRRALMLSGDLAEVAAAALAQGRAGLAAFELQIFRPLVPMLAQPADDVGEALERLGEAALEVKLDGARVQLHKRGDEVRVYSRRLNDVTAAVPELVESARALAADEIVLDGEAIALRQDGRPLPFQTTMRRFGRRLDTAAARRELPLSVYYFDCLRLGAESLVARPGKERLAALDEAVSQDLRVERLVTADPAAAEAMFRRALDRGHEGLMAKSLSATYQAGGRGKSWLKLKSAHTLDLVVLAAEWGSGRRRGWLSNLHLGARDPESGGHVMLGKTFKGMTDDMLTWQTDKLLSLEVGRDPRTVYVRPELVVEVAFSDVQESPHYPGGLALRFARIKRYRADKRAAQADTIDAVRAIFAASRS